MQRAEAYAAASYVEASYYIDPGFRQLFAVDMDFERVVQVDDVHIHIHIRKVAVVVVHNHMAVVGVDNVDSVEATLEFLVKKNHRKNLYHLIPNHV